MSPKINIIWLRRDLRLFDNAALYRALKSNENVLPLFIFDEEILTKLNNKKDSRLTFIHQQVAYIKTELKSLDSDILVKYGKPLDVWKKITEEFDVQNVFANQDYEPYAIQRDKQISEFLKSKNIGFETFKDQVIFDYTEVLKDDNTPYAVYTPYSKKWKLKLTPFHLKEYPCEKYYSQLYKNINFHFPTLEEIGFAKSDIFFPNKQANIEIIKNYDQTRDIPSINGTSRLSLHLRFGTISIRQLTKTAMKTNEKYLYELIWREFYMQILAHFPKVVDSCFRPEYNRIEWRNNSQEFELWCQGLTGYPIVDAGMRELNETGHMHNRVRMIVSSFLTKHLLIDWRWGEQYFAEKLLDFELASNNGGWQWSAGCGVDAAPYFRIFNPYIQTEKFDKEKKYIHQWLPDLKELSYPKPIVEHDFARKRCLEVYKKSLG